IGQQCPYSWRTGSDKVTKDEFLATLQMVATNYDGVETMPHEPRLPGLYYCHPPVQGGDGTALAELLGRFSPASPVDRDLLKALFLSAFWGGPPGQRPGWLITSDEDGTGAADRGRGTGKTTLAQMVGRLAGGLMKFGHNEDIRDIHVRLFSPGGQD